MDVRVVVYHQPDCPPCHAAMDFLARHGVPFVGKDVAEDPQALRELMELGSHSTPTITVGDKVMIGFRKDELLAMLGLPGSRRA
jgi:glutaredoxin